MSDQGDQQNPWPAAVVELQESLGLSVRKFADYLGVDPSAVTRWRGGGRRPRGLQRRLLLAEFKARGIEFDEGTGDTGQAGKDE